MRIIMLFNLKPATDPAAYEAWAKTRDIPGVRSMPSVDDFQVYRTTGLFGSEGKPPYDYIEVIDIADMDGFWNDVATEAAKAVAKEFEQWVAAPPVFMLTDPLSLA